MKRVLSTIICLFAITIQSCDFDKFQDDPNRTTQADPGLILTDLIVNTFGSIDINAPFASRMLCWIDSRSDEQYYSWTRSGFGPYDQIRQAHVMQMEAERVAKPNYIALAKFFSAYHYYQLTMSFGDIPFSEAMGGFEDNFQPAYDSQEDVFDGILTLLDEANSQLISGANEAALVGDELFFGDLIKWRKSINSFRLRVLMTLSNQNGNSKIDIAGQFDDIYSDPTTYPIMESSDDNLQIQFYDQGGNRYTFFNSGNFQVAYPMERTLINLMKDTQDPRLFRIAEITENAANAGMSITDFDAYGGVDGSADFDDMVSESNSGDASFPNIRYSTDPTVEPGISMSYAELKFIIAEAAELGWISGDPAVHYNAAIRSNMEFYGVADAEINTYLAGVAYSSATGIEQINTQKFMTYFLNSGWESFFNQRRTGYPSFSTTAFNGGQVPTRWMYPQSESQLNEVNVTAAIANQGFGSDNINGEMWILN